MIFSSRLGPRTMAPLCRQLATSHSAGIPILRSLEIVSRNSSNSRLRNVVSGMAESIQAGSTLEQASREQSRYLPRFFVELVGAGEMGGRLDEIFDDLAKYYERTVELVRKIRSRFLYPIFLIVFLILVVNFMSALGQSATASGVDFDKLGRVFVEGIGRFLLKVAAVFAVAVILSRAGLLGWVVGLISTFLWPIAPLTRRFALSRFARSFGLLLRSGVPVTEALRKSAATANNPYIERSLLRCIPAIESGESVSAALSGCHYLSDLAREMIHSGEEAGRLDQHLEKVADLHEAEAMQAAKNLVVVTGVLIYLIVAVIIGSFVVRFWIGYFNDMLGDLGV